VTALRALACAAALVGLAACKYGQHVALDNAAMFFKKPLPVPNKIEDPVRPEARLAVLWVGHATVLIQMDDKFILTDPVFTETINQLWRRAVEPGLEVKSLPPLDLVLISHMHEDHLSLISLEWIEPKVKRMIVPEACSVYVPGYRFPTTELGWWESMDHNGMRITATRVKHDGSRYGTDGSWTTHGATGYVLEYHGLTVYFGGDASYVHDNYAETRRRFPSIDLAMLPIAPMRPHAFMKPMHMDADEAMTAFTDLGARWIMPIHFDTLINGEEDFGEPAEALRAAASTRQVDPGALAILKIGEQRVLVPR
jgi:L-ascorbate metabolism protein UlaG (beta-lactamase superfamily)